MKSANIITFMVLFPFIVVSAPADECPSEGGTKKFIQRQLEGKTSCYELTKSECLFIHEARDTCACTCDVLIKSTEEATVQQSVTYATAPAQPDGGCGCRRRRRGRGRCC
uniref:Uncharacterized protein n=1 Tax=Trichuris muris TaxID=70415 RepID=A0A5S6QG20_TRIMR